MQDADTKIIGYGLLVTGLIIIFLAAFNLYSILNGKTRAFDYFNLEPISLSTEAFIGSDLTAEQKNLVRQQTGGEFPSMEIASSELLNDSSNLLAHLFILGVFATIGSKISSIGVQLLRPIKIKANAEFPKK